MYASEPAGLPGHNSTEDFRAVAETFGGAVFVHRGKILYVNRMAEELTGYSRGELEGKSLLSFIHREDRMMVAERVRDRLDGKASVDRYEVRMIRKDGSHLWVDVSGGKINFDGGEAIVGTAFDVSARKRVEKTLREEKEEAQQVLGSLPGGLIVVSRDGTIEFMNTEAEQMLGLGIGMLNGKPLGDALRLRGPSVAGRRDPVLACLERDGTVEFTGRPVFRAGSGDVRYTVLGRSVTPAPPSDASEPSGRIALTLHTVTPGTDRAEAETDQATGLQNRAGFEREVADMLASGTDGWAVAYLDLDRFKIVNDSCGYEAGDQVIKDVVARLRREVRGCDRLARLGGDGFGILYRDVSLQEARDLTDQLREVLKAEHFEWEDRLFEIGASAGLVAPEIDSEVAGLLRAADTACYLAKRQGRDFTFLFADGDPILRAHQQEVEWLHRVQHALKEDRFRLFVQPMGERDGNDRENVVKEILVRMVGDGGDLILPGNFIPVAERYHLMNRIDRWVVSQVLDCMVRGEGPVSGPGTIAINLSGQTMGDDEFLAYVVERLDETGIVPERLCFEVTETAVIENIGKARRFIGVLRDLGCRFALDDFGSGLSSFNYLRNLPVDILKIDGDFVRNIDKDETDRAMVKLMVDLGRTMGIKTVAEHVENEAAVRILREMGVDYLQGHFVRSPESVMEVVPRR